MFIEFPRRLKRQCGARSAGNRVERAKCQSGKTAEAGGKAIMVMMMMMMMMMRMRLNILLIMIILSITVIPILVMSIVIHHDGNQSSDNTDHSCANDE